MGGHGSRQRLVSLDRIWTPPPLIIAIQEFGIGDTVDGRIFIGKDDVLNGVGGCGWGSEASCTCSSLLSCTKGRVWVNQEEVIMRAAAKAVTMIEGFVASGTQYVLLIGDLDQEW